MSDELNREDGDLEDIFKEDETEKSNQDDGDQSEDAAKEAVALESFNKRVGKNYKSWEEVSKREKTIDEFYAKGGQKIEKVEKVEKTAPSSNVIKNLFFKANPEAEGVWEEVEKAAKLTGNDPFDLYSSETFLQEKAKAKFEARKAEEEAKSKVSDPSSGGKPFAENDWSKLTDEQVADLPPEKYEKYSKWRKSQSTGSFIFDN